MANAANHPVTVRCPHCRSPGAMEHPSTGELESFFCSDCRGFRLLAIHRPRFDAARSRIGRLHLAASGDRWLLPD